ncbi:MAG: hypothetical protein AMJ58_05490 [Gammaproteobacteria bacterium SG8_30]|nr:MAG: hypothetical protein AMJ58_05490 [Gammaproteobacteria bacterium SG8_30]
MKSAQSERQLRRLERLMDIVFGLVIWRIFTILPRPSMDNPEWDSVAEMLVSEWASFVVPVLAILIVTVYWLQNNAMFGKLKATDSVHTGISIFQIFFVLFYLYALGLGIEVGSAADTRVLESSAATLVGITAFLGWWYASTRAELLSDEVTPEEAAKFGESNLAEPLTALLTIPAAFLGPGAWELSWFLYPLLKKFFDRRKARRTGT